MSGQRCKTCRLYKASRRPELNGVCVPCARQAEYDTMSQQGLGPIKKEEVEGLRKVGVPIVLTLTKEAYAPHAVTVVMASTSRSKILELGKFLRRYGSDQSFRDQITAVYAMAGSYGDLLRWLKARGFAL